MGLTVDSVGRKAVDIGLTIQKSTPEDKVIALAGNPNVGKSTVFNGLTGMKQHTGNWPGKTVTNEQGMYRRKGKNYVLVDIPGTYSLMAHSTEEEIARDFICFGDPDAVVVVCDATCLERNLNLVLQTIEITNQVVVCVNLMDEAKKKRIHIDLSSLSNKLGVPVVGTNARNKKGLEEMIDTVDTLLNNETKSKTLQIQYPTSVEKAIELLQLFIESKISNCRIQTRWIALKLLEFDSTFIESLSKYLNFNIAEDSEFAEKRKEAWEILEKNEISPTKLNDSIVSSIVLTAEEVFRDTVSYNNQQYQERDRKIDRILTNRWTGFPIMIALLGVVFWITISGANVPSSMLASGLFWIEDRLVDFAIWAGIPSVIYEVLIFGVYRVLAWVISVMLPPMAIFFPIFTFLEDLGYLPRVAFNLDKTFQRCCACGKQALTMCMVYTIL